jgi:hypothetical protein
MARGVQERRFTFGNKRPDRLQVSGCDSHANASLYACKRRPVRLARALIRAAAALANKVLFRHFRRHNAASATPSLSAAGRMAS